MGAKRPQRHGAAYLLKKKGGGKAKAPVSSQQPDPVLPSHKILLGFLLPSHACFHNLVTRARAATAVPATASVSSCFMCRLVLCALWLDCGPVEKKK
jgi:hypothetical protein